MPTKVAITNITLAGRYMKRLDNYLDRHIGAVIQKANDHERANHKSSGKLSASALGSPLQWQILKSLGVPEKPHDEYTLRKFKRGKDVEQWFLSLVPGLIIPEKQEFVEYRGVVGYMDAWVDTEAWEFPLGEMPLECKSTANSSFKYIVKEGPKIGHKYQAGLYALGRAVKHYAISYVATDDYRVQTYVLDVEEVEKDINNIIDLYNSQKATGKVPVFVAKEKWQADPKYNNYPEWSNLDEAGCAKKLAEFLASKKV